MSTERNGFPVYLWMIAGALVVTAASCSAIAMTRFEQRRLQTDEVPTHAALPANDGEWHGEAPELAKGGIYGVIPGDSAKPARFIQCIDLQPGSHAGERSTFNQESELWIR